MATEIERKFLVHLDLALLDWDSAVRLRQGYVLVGKQLEVRIRRVTTPHTTSYKLTVKWGVGFIRREWEFEVWAVVGVPLLWLSGGRSLEKIRLKVGRFELDSYLGRHHTLEIAEIELERPDQELPVFPVGVTLVREVTGEAMYKNSELAQTSVRSEELGAQRFRTTLPAPLQE